MSGEWTMHSSLTPAPLPSGVLSGGYTAPAAPQRPLLDKEGNGFALAPLLLKEGSLLDDFVLVVPERNAALGRHFFGVPKGIRTPVTAVKGQCPRPPDDGDCGAGWWKRD